jgi:hypothetical protein
MEDAMKRLLALVLCAGLAAPGCATSQASRLQTSPQVLSSGTDRTVLADFARQLPVGARVRATTASNNTIRGTLLKTTDTAIVVQPRARIAEPLVEIPFKDLMALEQENPRNGSSTGRAIAIGASVGAGAALGVLFVLAAIFAGN